VRCHEQNTRTPLICFHSVMLAAPGISRGFLKVIKEIPDATPALISDRRRVPEKSSDFGIGLGDRL